MAKKTHDITDEELFVLLQKGNEHALKPIYDKYWKRMYAYAYKVVEDSLLCEDIIQEIFISLWEKATTSTIEIHHLEAYLFKALKFKTLNALRNNKLTEFHEKILAEIPLENDGDTTLTYNDLEKQVVDTMETLPEKCRNVFYLSRIKEYNNREIASELNISPRTVETHIRNALKHFRLHFPNHLYYFFVFILFKIYFTLHFIS
ncbi:RNA polymerase sigma-70 factor [Galbibacter sp. EGI 63066]|uniref:RNA polymerase sigma factor n=1 Tax=Galbibacter sp. EGI 63066 TaxID=2993559 RepID=UPI0022497C43|nr:RNA polymerase sigma-70 factor [Galbibacter sp. EGI 63066]MCX2682034.1 RNA polymerase sigma-70 factor [Galbibacter sp. EGI 63066]